MKRALLAIASLILRCSAILIIRWAIAMETIRLVELTFWAKKTPWHKLKRRLGVLPEIFRFRA